jgi:two-component system response regulator FlrC
MDGLEYTAALAARHAPLVQRVAAVVTALGGIQPVVLGDAEETRRTPAGPQRAQVTLAAAPHPMLQREGRQRFALTYRDAGSEAALGALIACLLPEGPIAADPESLSVLALAERLAMSEIPVLIGGPTGTGKEVLSRFIHDRSPRRAGPFVAVNCAAMPETMLEALLFGHAKGAFTGAATANEGFFRAADGGTLLLDEIAEMPLALQAKLLRVLQEGEVVPIGSTRPVKINVRIIAAANRDLPTEVAEGRFRADLFYRLNVFPLALTPLQERPEDIAPLAFAMLLRHAPAGRRIPWISDDALDLLRGHGWPGNVRELENVMRRALVLVGHGNEIAAAHIQFDLPARLVAGHETPAISGVVPARLAKIVQRSEAQAIMETLQSCGGSRIETARRLGISERTLRYRLASFREAGLAVGGGRR